MRYLTNYIQKDLQKKLVLLSGPRQVGKSTLAKGLLDARGVYLNWDVREDQRTIRNIAWPKDSSLVILDELHKLPKWKNFLKGIIDEYANKPPLLVTGSARLEIFRKSGDALTGRTYHYRLHPIDLRESQSFLPKLSSEKRLERLLDAGGFPEAFMNPSDASRLRNDRFDFVLREDLRDLSKTNSLRSLEILIELLRERVGRQIIYSNLAQDLSVSAPTVKSWIDLLERLYIIFLVPPYHHGLARSIRKEPKVFFYDCAAAFDEKEPRLENLAACALLKYCHLQHDHFGRPLRLSYFRDREGREVDFVVSEGPKVKWCIEVKSEDDKLHLPLLYLSQRVKPETNVQLVRSLKKEKEIEGIRIVSLADWFENISS